jgi:hypothetical protein
LPTTAGTRSASTITTRRSCTRAASFDDLPISIGAIHRSQTQLYLGYAMGHARLHGLTLRALQVFWPDKHGHFPTDLACDSDVLASQPRLALAATPSEQSAFRRTIGDL